MTTTITTIMTRNNEKQRDTPTPTPTNVATTIRDRDVWFDKPRHPGTRSCRKAVRWVLEDYGDDAKWTKAIFRAVLRELPERTRFMTGRTLDRVRECSDKDELRDRLQDLFDEEQLRCLDHMSSKHHYLSLSLNEEEGRERRKSSKGAKLPPVSRGKRLEGGRRKKHAHDRRSKLLWETSESDKGNNDRFNISNKVAGRRRRRRQRTDVDSDSDQDKATLQSFKRQQTNHLRARNPDRVCPVYMDSTCQKARKKLRLVVRKEVVDSNDTRFSSSKLRRILDTMGAATYRWSKEDDTKLTNEEIRDEIGKVYEEETHFLTVAKPRDVYFDSPFHLGTKAWIRALRQVMMKYDEEYGEEVYRHIKDRLYDSSFYIGRPPDCERASRSEISQMFQEQYNIERAKRDQIAKKSQKEPIPGNRYWKQLGMGISNHISSWGWYQSRLERVSMLPLCTSSHERCCTPCHQRIIHPLRSAFEPDRCTGQLWYEKFASRLEVPFFGGRTSGPSLVLFGMIFVICICFIWDAILKRIVFGIIE